MEELRVPKRRVGAQIVLPGGETRDVVVFLAEATPERSGGERLSDLLNDGSRFLPAMDEVRLVDGQRLQGLITYVMPEGRTRLTDYFNDAQPFLRLVQGSQVALVNKRHVAYVETLTR